MLAMIKVWHGPNVEPVDYVVNTDHIVVMKPSAMDEAFTEIHLTKTISGPGFITAVGPIGNILPLDLVK